MKESFKNKTPDSETLKIADDSGEVFEWEVSHQSGDMVYLKHYYDTADEARFIYRGMSRARFSEMTNEIEDDNSEYKIEQDSEEREPSYSIPATFNEIRNHPGHSIEDLLDAVGDVADSGKGWLGKTSIDDFIDARRANLDTNDLSFVKNISNTFEYEKEIYDFSVKLQNENPYRHQRGVLHSHMGWTQHDSKAFIKSRIEDKNKDTADSRFYLNPPIANMMEIYKTIFERAEAEGLRFCAKVLDFDLRARGQRSTTEAQREKAKMWAENPTLRNDPMVFYGYADSKERLYEIIKDVYSAHEEIFQGRQLGFAPHEIAPGFGVGEEPVELSGRESLSSFLEGVIGSVARNSDWRNGKTPADRKHLFAEAFRKTVKDKKLPINPDNIAFR